MDKADTKPRIRTGRIEIDFPYQGKILTAVHPFYGPANSLNLLRQIRDSGFREPASLELASFVYEYFDGQEPQALEVNKIMKDNYFRGFTGILYLPQEKTAHFIDNPEFDENSFVNRDNLLKRLSESRAQVPFEHLRQGPVSWRDVGKHPYFVAWAGGEDGAEKLAELASKHPRQEAYVWVPDVSNLKEPTARVAGLGSDWDDVRLYVGSGGHGIEGSFAFGVLKDAEGIAPKK